MSRDEARKRLHGTFSFKIDGGKVVVTDEVLIREIHDLLANASECTQAPDWSASGNIARPFGYGATA